MSKEKTVVDTIAAERRQSIFVVEFPFGPAKFDDAEKALAYALEMSGNKDDLEEDPDQHRIKFLMMCNLLNNGVIRITNSTGYGHSCWVKRQSRYKKAGA